MSMLASAQAISVKILADDSYPPYSYVENGQLKGHYVEQVKEIATYLPEYQIELVAMPWKRALKEISEGRAFALLPPYQHPTERPYINPYSLSLGVEQVVVFCQQGINLAEYLEEAPLEQLKPLNLGINAGYLILNDQLIQAVRDGKIKLWENKNTRANIIKLVYQRVDCFINDKYSTLWELGRAQQVDGEINFDAIAEMMTVMRQSAHLGYTNAANHPFYFKDDFVSAFDQVLMQVQLANNK